MIVVTEENKDQINSALTAKLLDFNINIPSILNDIKLLNLDNLNGASADVSNKLNVDVWFNNTIACMDISAGCQGCDTSQTDFGECKGGCFGINTGCSDCQGTDAVPVCTSCDNGETCEQQPTIIEVCTSCDEGCFVCDSACFRCDGGCQGTQTCHSCNNGEGCTTGCENNFHAGCDGCQLDFELCDNLYQPPCGRDQAVIQCQSACNTGCVSNDIDYCKEEHLVCEGDQSQICDEHQQFEYSNGCVNNDKACVPRDFHGSCSYQYSYGVDYTCRQVGNDCGGTYNYAQTNCGESACEGKVTAGNCNNVYKTCNYKFHIDTCINGYKQTNEGDGVSESCPSNYTQTYGPRGETGNISCIKEYSQNNTSGYPHVHCQLSYNGNDGNSCVQNFAQISTEDGLIVECPSNFKQTCYMEVISCPSGYKAEDDSILCYGTYSDGLSSCNGGYSTNGTDINCPSNYADATGTECPSNYGQDPQVVCTNCNGGRNNVCTSCDGGQAPDCPGCFGMTDNANCQSGCVLGQADTCDANCVTVGNGGCSDCQGCDSGCNLNVSCDATFRYDENGKIDCKVTYTDTSCSQTCVNGFNSNTDCFQCVVCDSTCESCETSCQGGCQNCEIGCQGYCDVACQNCEGGCNSACYSCDSACDTSCYNGCDSCDGACDIHCQDCQSGCQECETICQGGDGCPSGQSQCAGAWCGTSQGY